MQRLTGEKGIMMTMEKVEVAPQETMLNLISGFWMARSLYLAAQLGIADLFDDQPLLGGS
jgi:hypothetical protein